MAPPDLGRSVNPISTTMSRLCLPYHITTGTPGFSDSPTALISVWIPQGIIHSVISSKGITLLGFVQYFAFIFITEWVLNFVALFDKHFKVFLRYTLVKDKGTFDNSVIMKSSKKQDYISNVYLKVIHPKYYKHLKKDAHQSHLGKQKMGWFLVE